MKTSWAYSITVIKEPWKITVIVIIKYDKYDVFGVLVRIQSMFYETYISTKLDVRAEYFNVSWDTNLFKDILHKEMRLHYTPLKEMNT